MQLGSRPSSLLHHQGTNDVTQQDRLVLVSQAEGEAGTSKLNFDPQQEHLYRVMSPGVPLLSPLQVFLLLCPPSMLTIPGTFGQRALSF